MVAASTQTRTASLMPNAGENYRSFVFRAHNQLLQTIPDPDDRNQAVWDAWDASRGNPLRNRAMSYFPTEKYRHVPNICYFYEHETTGRDGSVHHYSFNELADIMDAGNKRADTNRYSSIASHHTSDNAKGPDVEPETVGFAGTYSLGMVGHDEPKWAVFADEFHRNDQRKLFDKRRGRSVEVLRFKDGRTPFFDPIATLGADSPRLALPVARYECEDSMVERYSFVAAASPGANGTYIPTLGKEKYDQQPQPFAPTEGSSMLSPDDIQQVVQAIRSIPELAWARQQMQSAQGGLPDDQSAGAAAGSPSANPGGPTPASPIPQQPQSHNAPGMGGQKPFSPPFQQPHQQQLYSQEDDDVNVSVEQYTALQEANASLAERYARVQASNEKLMESQLELREAVINLERRAVDGERTQAIAELCERYEETRVFDREELLETCLYSRGATLSQEDFQGRLASLEKVAQRVTAASPVNQKLIPEGQTAQEANETERYEMVMDRFAELKRQGKGKGLSFDIVEDQLISDGKLAAVR